MRRSVPVWGRMALPLLFLALMLGLAATANTPANSAGAAPLLAPSTAVDSAAWAGLVQLNAFFQANRTPDCGVCVQPVTPEQDGAVRAAIAQVLGSNFDAWYLDDLGQQFGSAQIGSVGSVPFALGLGPTGVRGVEVRRAKPPGPFSSYALTSLWTVDHAPAYPARFWPVAVFTDTTALRGPATFLNYASTYAPGNWGLVCFSANCGQIDVAGWLANGFDPANGVDLYTESSDGGVGPAVTYSYYPVGWDGTNPDTQGVWQSAKPGNSIGSACSTMQLAAAEHWHVLLPVVNRDDGGYGWNLHYHVTTLAMFEVQAVSCPGTHNYLSGQFLGYTWPAGAATGIGDLRRAAVNGETVLPLDPALPTPTPLPAGTSRSGPRLASRTRLPALQP